MPSRSPPWISAYLWPSTALIVSPVAQRDRGGAAEVVVAVSVAVVPPVEAVGVDVSDGVELACASSASKLRSPLAAAACADAAAAPSAAGGRGFAGSGELAGGGRTDVHRHPG